MENNNKKRQFILSIIGIFLLILFSVGIVYAFFNYSRIGARNNVINTADLNFEFVDSDWIWLENAYPINTEQALAIETTGSNEMLDVDGGIAQFTITGGHSGGAINYHISLIKEDLTQVTNSKNNKFTLDPSTKIGQLPDGAISINIQTSLSNIFDETGLVNSDDSEFPGRNVGKPYNNCHNLYMNDDEGIKLSCFENESNNSNEKVIANGLMSGSNATRYFELRMWINEHVLIDEDLRVACASNTNPSAIEENGIGYCSKSTPGLPSNIDYVYSMGEFAKLYYSSRIKIQTDELENGVIKPEPTEVVSKLTENVVAMEETASTFNNVALSSSDSGLFLMKSTENDRYPIYYYRGHVDNNNVIFADKCWKIVRTTENGGTKLVYNGTPNDGKCTATTGNLTTTGTPVNFHINYGSTGSPIYVGYTYDVNNRKHSEYFSVSDYSAMSASSVVYGKDVTYDSNTGRYSLQNTVTLNKSNFANDISDEDFGKHHYTCFTSNSYCQGNVYYIYNADSDGFYAFNLDNGNKIDDLLEGSFTTGTTGTNNTLLGANPFAMLKSWVNNNNFDQYNDYLEDSVFCNDRSIYNYGGFSIDNYNNTGDIGLLFSASNRLVRNNEPSVVCSRDEDKYTRSYQYGNAKLVSKVGMLTADEYVLAGAKYNKNNTAFYLYNGLDNLTMTPAQFTYDNSYLFYINNSGKLLFGRTDMISAYVRPTIVLSEINYFESGDGTANSPYIVGELEFEN